MNNSKHRKTSKKIFRKQRDICPRCTKSIYIINASRSPRVLTYYKNLCRSSKCCVHSKNFIPKIRKSKISVLERNSAELWERQRIDLYKTLYDVDEFEEEKDSEDIDFKMFQKIEATVKEPDLSSEECFESIAGFRILKEIINKTIIWPLKKPEIFKGLRTAPKGVLLFGPPGAGKTYLGKLIASESNSTFFNIMPSTLTSKYMGENEKLVRTLFLVAKARQPSVIFIDEVESILSRRNDSENGCIRRIKNEFFVCMEGSNLFQNERIMIVGATSKPEELDEGARHRFYKRLYIPLPDASDRKGILSKLLERECHSLEEIDVCDIVKKTEGYSVADLKNLSQEAAMGPIKNLADSAITRLRLNKIRPISMEDFLCALQLIKPTVTLEQIKAYEEWDSLYGYGGDEEAIQN